MYLRSVRTVSRLLPLLLLALVPAMPGAAHAIPSAEVTNGAVVTRERYDQAWRAIVSIREPRFPAAGRRVSDQYRHTCGGTLIRRDVVLTAAHCVTDMGYELARPRSVLVGTRRLSTSKRSFGESVPVAEVILHPAWAGFRYWGDLRWDVALLRLARPVTRGAVMPLVAADERELWGGGAGLSGDRAHVAGWGVTATRYPWDEEGETGAAAAMDHDEPEKPSPWTQQLELREASFPLLPDRLCGSTDSAMKEDARSFDPASMLCGGSADSVRGTRSDRRGACHGDSGGPLIVAAADGSPRLVGVVSWGPSEDGPCNSLSVFARVDGVRDWVDARLAELDQPPTVSAPDSARATDLGRGAIRLRWPDIVGEHTHVRLLRELGWTEMLSPGEALPARVPQWLRTLRIRTEVARGLAGTSALNVRNLAPRRAGSTMRYRFRVEVGTPGGRRFLGPPLFVTPRTDPRRPSRPGAPRRIGTLQGAPLLGWTASRDDDCVAAYALELRRAGRRGTWRPHSVVPTARCNRIDPDDEWYGDGWRPLRRAVFDVPRGTWFARVVAVDRAGNRGVGRPVRVRVPRYVEDLDLEPECRIRGENVVCVYPKDEY